MRKPWVHMRTCATVRNRSAFRPDGSVIACDCHPWYARLWKIRDPWRGVES